MKARLRSWYLPQHHSDATHGAGSAFMHPTFFAVVVRGEGLGGHTGRA
jgi:hypothetical protein